MQRLIRALLMLVMYCCLSMGASGQVANFTIDDSAGCAPLVVHFTNTTACASCTYTWSLGNTTTSTLTDVSTSYITPGTYTVTLTAHNGAINTVRTSQVVVFPAPTVNFTADDTSVCPGVPVTFTSTSTGGVPGPMTYNWNFGDGDSSTAVTPAHPFALPGFYNITLSVTNAEGCVSALTRNGYEHIFSKPVPNFTGSPTSACSAPATVNFSNTSTGTGLTYNWSFGDNGTAGSLSPAHNYTAPGIYTVKLKTTNINGCIDSLIRTSYINIGGLAASFTAPATGCVGSGITFSNTSTPHVWSSWNFGDASGSALESPVHVFTAAGTYTVSLVVSDGPCFSTKTKTITINPLPTATVTATPDRPCPPPVPISFNATGSPGATFAWASTYAIDTFHLSGPSVTHTYSSTGIYLVTLTVTSPLGCSITIEKTDTIFFMNLKPGRGCDTLDVEFTAVPESVLPPDGSPILYPYTPYSYSWSFGDGATGTGDPLHHTYSATGTYVATVTLTTGNGCTATKQIPVTPILTIPTLTVTPTHICFGDSVTLTADAVTGPADDYEWYFGDGGTVIKPTTVTHWYTRPGEFVPTVTAMYHGCKGRRFVTTDTVTVDSPMAAIQFGYSCINKDRVAFYDTVSMGASSHLWVFGDGDSSTATNPVHTYPAIGYYKARLFTFNSASGCSSTDSQSVSVLQLHPNFSAIDSTVCRDDTVRFVSTVADSPNVTASLYEWYVNGTFLPTETHSVYKRICSAKGIYTISLVSIDAHTCRDTITKPNYLHVAKPVARFGANTVGCAPLTATFVDSTTDIPGTAIAKFKWTFGDSWSDTTLASTIAHTYTAGGTYSVTEMVTDEYGCKDTLTKPSYIRVIKPYAFFYADNSHSCVGVPVSFTNMTGGVASAWWQFGDGATSMAMSPVHVYTSPGSYTVRLAITDTAGCHDTAVYTGYMNVTKPRASFEMNDTFNICPPLTVNFTNTSTGGLNYVWNFGDSNSSVMPSPTNVYVHSGMYNPRLIVTDAYGCKDTAFAHASVYGYAGAFGYTPLSGCSPLSVHFSGALTTSATGVTWDFADGVTVSGAFDTINHSYTTPGTYIPKLILTDTSGCTNFSLGLDTIKVERVNAAFKSLPDHVCKGGTISFIDSSTTRFSPVYSWSWSMDGGTSTLTSPTHTFTNSGTFPITLTATNSWGCTGTITKTVRINPLPTVNASPDTVACAGSAIKLKATGAATYTWSGGPLSCTTCDTTNAIPTVSTTYSVTGIDTNGCVNKDTVRITILSAIAGGGGAMCPGSSITLSNIGLGTWSSADTAIATIAPVSGVVTGVAAGTVTMSYTLPAGCFATVAVTVNAMPAPIVVPPGICAGATDSVRDATAGGRWRLSSGATATIDTVTGVVSSVTPGTSTVTYTLPTGCATTAVVTVNPVPGPITGNAPMCIGAGVTLANSVTGGSWRSADTATATVTAAGAVTGIKAGTTTVTYDRAGCTATTIVTVEPIPDAGIISGPSVVCVGASITLSDTATGTWSGINDTVATIGTSGIVNGLTTGTAVFVYTTPANAAGCFDTAMFTVDVSEPAYVIMDSIVNVSCYGGHDGRIAVTIDRPQPYTYAWSTGSDSSHVDSLTIGTYSLTVTSTADQCYKTASFTVTQPDLLTVDTATSPDSCFAGSGSITLHVKGGVSPYNFAWSNQATDSVVKGLMSGRYTVTVTDMHSCMVQVVANVGEDSCFEIFTYDVITPNGDGVNDTWVVQGLDRYPQNTVQIFDKWGDLVYERPNYGNEWYGQGKGAALLPDGTYFYLIKLNAPNRMGGENVFKGTVLIKR